MAAGDLPRDIERMQNGKQKLEVKEKLWESALPPWFAMLNQGIPLRVAKKLPEGCEVAEKAQSRLPKGSVSVTRAVSLLQPRDGQDR